MAQTLNSNLAALIAQRHIGTSQNLTSTAMQRLSSGLRVNSAKDDAAGQAIAERMTSQVRGMNAAVRNSNDGISLAQTAESGLGKASDALQRMRELAIQAANDTNTTSDRDSLDKEFGKLANEVQRVLASTSFNGKKVLDTDAGIPLTFQVGANATSNDSITLTITQMTTAPEIMAAAGDDPAGTNRPTITPPLSQPYADTITDIDSAITLINDQRAELGATQNRFEAIISNLQVAAEAQGAAKSRIMDADYAAESANLSRAQILNQAGNAMLAQANQQPQQIMKLLQG